MPLVSAAPSVPWRVAYPGFGAILNYRNRMDADSPQPVRVAVREAIPRSTSGVGFEFLSRSLGTQSGTTNLGDFWDDVGSAIKALGQGATALSPLFQPGGTTKPAPYPGTPPLVPGPYPGMSTGATVAIGGGSLLAIGAIAYLLLRKRRR